jgi:hypothetical protein
MSTMHTGVSKPRDGCLLWMCPPYRKNSVYGLELLNEMVISVCLYLYSYVLECSLLCAKCTVVSPHFVAKTAFWSTHELDVWKDGVKTYRHDLHRISECVRGIFASGAYC